MADFTPTERAQFCNQVGPMGGGCEDSWHVGGNYGSHVCRNPAHHDDDVPTPKQREEEVAEALVEFKDREVVYALCDALGADQRMDADWLSSPELNALFHHIARLRTHSPEEPEWTCACPNWPHEIDEECVRRADPKKHDLLFLPTKATLRDWIDSYHGPPGTIVDHLHAHLKLRVQQTRRYYE